MPISRTSSLYNAGEKARAPIAPQCGPITAEILGCIAFAQDIIGDSVKLKLRVFYRATEYLNQSPFLVRFGYVDQELDHSLLRIQTSSLPSNQIQNVWRFSPHNHQHIK